MPSQQFNDLQFYAKTNNSSFPNRDAFIYRVLIPNPKYRISLFFCLVLGVSGYGTFTNKVQGNVLNNFDKGDFVMNIARTCFAANMFFTIPLEAFVCREVAFQYFFTDPDDSPSKVQHVLDNIDTFTHVSATCIIIFSAMTIALLTCDLGFVLEITVTSTVLDLTSGGHGGLYNCIYITTRMLHQTDKTSYSTKHMVCGVYPLWHPGHDGFNSSKCIQSYIQRCAQSLHVEDDPKMHATYRYQC
jgi:hypothetical protein